MKLEIWASFYVGGLFGRAPPQNGRAPTNGRAHVFLHKKLLSVWSRAPRWSRTSPEWSRTTPSLGLCRKLPQIRLACFLARIFDFHLHNKSDLRGKLAFIGSL